ncbi:unnamed protein product [Penicillium salamii]|uniref:Uncharacterized protein n=1 Tax=Penicillium salamii TaxID=1612424 RepID=A0A9W4IBI7_9EURO|nr:unnamed protein product [Penicillium salamii]
MVDEKAMQSILSILAKNLDKYNTTVFMILINKRWPLEYDAEELATIGRLNNDYKLIYGCTSKEVG